MNMKYPGNNQEMTQPNVIVAVIDALRTDYLNQTTAPWLSKLASNNVYFDQAFSPINATEPLLASFYTGKYPRTTGIYNHGTHLTQSDVQTLEQETFLQERFQSAGYETMAFDWLGNWHKSGYDFYSGQLTEKDEQTDNQGKGNFRPVIRRFKRHILNAAPPKLVDTARRFKFKFSPPTVETSGWLPDPADEIADAAFRKMTDASTPKYTFLHFWDTHAPYNVPDEYIQSFGDPSDPVTRYQAAISFVDDNLKQLYNELKSATDRPTVMLIMGDHGESLGEHGIYYDHHGLYDVSLRIPVIFSHPALPSQTVSEFVQHVDLAPTISEFVLGESFAEHDGRALLSTIHEGDSIRNAVFAEEAHAQRKAAIRTDRYKYIETIDDSPVCSVCHVIHGGKRELYDLERDPEETINLVGSEPEVESQLRKRLSNWSENHQTSRITSSDSENQIEDPELEERLKKLGYI